MTDQELEHEFPLLKRMMYEREGEYIRRVNGDIECEICNNPYKFHPYDQEILEFYPEYYLHKLCNGILGKT